MPPGQEKVSRWNSLQLHQAETAKELTPMLMSRQIPTRNTNGISLRVLYELQRVENVPEFSGIYNDFPAGSTHDDTSVLRSDRGLLRKVTYKHEQAVQLSLAHKSNHYWLSLGSTTSKPIGPFPRRERKMTISYRPYKLSTTLVVTPYQMRAVPPSSVGYRVHAMAGTGKLHSKQGQLKPAGGRTRSGGRKQ
ncbi:MAG: hypothetical protein M1830_006448, partial [Pleopsidium flavum]